MKDISISVLEKDRRKHSGNFLHKPKCKNWPVHPFTEELHQLHYAQLSTVHNQIFKRKYTGYKSIADTE